jgi:hypothetical protein
MKIFSVKIKGVDRQLVEPIDIIEDVSYSKGKQMFDLTNGDFGLLVLCRDKEVGRIAIQEQLDMIIGEYLFKSDYTLSKGEIKLRERIRRHVYG